MSDRVTGPSGPVPPDPNRTASDASVAPALRLVRELPGSANPPADVRSHADSYEDAYAHDTDELSPALEDVVRRFGSFMRRTAHRHNLAASELEDVVQETRIRLWKALGTPDKIRKASASYIYRTTMSAVLDFMRRRRVRRENSLDQIVEAPLEPLTALRSADDTLQQSDVERAVARAIDLLVESRRGVVRMYLAGYDREEIAELLGWSEPKTRNLLYRGLADVRVSLEAWGYGPGAKS